MSKQQQIDSIISLQYGNYEGEFMKGIESLHNLARKSIGDDEFLEYLIKSKSDNPRPVYVMPKINQTN